MHLIFAAFLRTTWLSSSPGSLLPFALLAQQSFREVFFLTCFSLRLQGPSGNMAPVTHAPDKQGRTFASVSLHQKHAWISTCLHFLSLFLFLSPPLSLSLSLFATLKAYFATSQSSFALDFHFHLFVFELGCQLVFLSFYRSLPCIQCCFISQSILLLIG